MVKQKSLVANKSVTGVRRNRQKRKTFTLYLLLKTDAAMDGWLAGLCARTGCPARSTTEASQANLSTLRRIFAL